ncbi:Holliday junction resolvase RuvX [uncultured Muriicola sp.]|uniref:Holliday junction resolvase RuvX n=1 Tax=uncultured Muriicola sp. TaxID=1583102 RepID=UPI00260359F6|nr:Holliday junction resolvase RuvX [uncultured Muriicola sp.]
MGRIIGLDYGKVRTGIAVTDELQLIASGLTTVLTSDLLTFLKDYVSEENVTSFVVGEPKQMNNTPSESEILIGPFIQVLKQSFPEIPVYRQDERFTSQMAVKSMVASGMKRKDRREKAMVDKISATLILQGYLDRIK